MTSCYCCRFYRRFIIFIIVITMIITIIIITRNLRGLRWNRYWKSQRFHSRKWRSENWFPIGTGSLRLRRNLRVPNRKRSPADSGRQEMKKVQFNIGLNQNRVEKSSLIARQNGGNSKIVWAAKYKWRQNRVESKSGWMTKKGAHKNSVDRDIRWHQMWMRAKQGDRKFICRLESEKGEQHNRGNRSKIIGQQGWL
jgi:hypothetical protein